MRHIYLLLMFFTSITLAALSIEYLLIVNGHRNAPLHLQAELSEDQRMFKIDKELIYIVDYKTNNNPPLDYKPNDLSPIMLRPDVRLNNETNSTTKIVWTIGDSFTYGHNVNDDQTFPAQLEKFITDKGYDINVFNFGTPGYGVDQEYAQIMRYIDVFRPSIIILSLNMNDIDDSNDNCLFRVTTQDNKISLAKVPALTSTMYLQTFLREILPPRIFQSHLFDIAMRAARLTTRTNYLCTLSPGNETKRKMMKKIAQLLSDLQQQLIQRNVTLVVTVMPTQIYFEETKEPYELRLIKESVKSAGLEVIDFNKIFTRSSLVLGATIGSSTSATPANVGADFFLSKENDPEASWGNIHPNKQGYFIIAESLSDLFLKQNREN